MPRPSMTSSPAFAAPTPTMSTTSMSDRARAAAHCVFGLPRERDDIGSLEHRPQIAPVGTA